MMKVSDRMTSEVVTLNEEQSLRDALTLQQRHKIRHIPVVADGNIVGILTDRDLKRASPSLLSGIDQERYDELLDTTRVAQVMTRDPRTVSPETSLKDVAKILIEGKFGALPVIEKNSLVGIITEIDLLRVLHDLLDE
ncbi:MAG: CBS domain-containing protein [Acidobacteria bacterium]|nr:MAG: CBS domain-containing protein [Acidobacteriota bacterium]